MSGKIHIDIDNYKLLMGQVLDVPGCFAEFGVFKGKTFTHIYEAALKNGREVHAVDSFVGMPKPILEGDEIYPEGYFDCGGSKVFRKKFPQAIVHEGFVPEILSEMDGITFAFVHVDLDHEASTKQALDWIWPRVNANGIVVCHDYWSDCTRLASKAINDWMRENNIRPSGIKNHSVWFINNGS